MVPPTFPNTDGVAIVPLPTVNCPQKSGGDNKTPENITPTKHRVINPEQEEGSIAHTALRFKDKSEVFSFHGTRSLKIILGKFLLACKCNYA